MLTTRMTIFAALLSLLIGGSHSAADSPLDLIPADAVLVVRIGKPSANKEAIVTCARRLQQIVQTLPVNRPADMEPDDWGKLARESLEELIDTLGLSQHLDEEQDFWIYSPQLGSSGGPLNPKYEFALIVPATDPSSLQKIVADQASKEDTDTDTYVNGNWVIIGTKSAIVKSKSCSIGDDNSFRSRINDTADTIIHQHHIGLFVDLDRLRASNGVTQELIQEFLFAVITSFTTDVSPDETRQSTNRLAHEFAEVIAQLIWDLDSLAISVGLDAEDLSIEQFLSVRAESPTARFFRDNPGSDLKVLSSLPASSAVTAGFHLNWEAISSWLMDATERAGFLAHKDSIEAMRRLQNEYAQLKYGSVGIALPVFPLDQGLIRSITIREVDQPLRARDLDRKSFELSKTLRNEGEDSVSVLTPDGEKYREFSADVTKQASLLQVGEMDLPIADFQEKLDQWLLGPDGNTSRTVYMKDRVVTTQGGSKLRTVAIVRRIADSQGQTPVSAPGMQQTRQKLGDTANLIVMADAGGLVAAGMGLWNLMIDQAMQAENQVAIVKDVKHDADDSPDEDKFGRDDIEIAKKPPVPQPPANEVPTKFPDEAIKSLRENPTLIGISFSLEPTGCRNRIVVPIAAMEKLITGFMFVQHFDEDVPNVINVPLIIEEEEEEVLVPSN